MLQIDLYTEITCPWCIVGQHRLDKVLAEHFPDLFADIYHHPVLLLPDAPVEGIYIPDLLRTRHGVIPARSRHLAHSYAEVDHSKVNDIAVTHAPQLLIAVREALREFPEPKP